ncbi:MXAN_6640 family putative metalloprotease [Nocardioides sp.]|uniref:MXAN_6640 family putative metalloprotease n=1 Tax=Nocardioides sp. TaxID=35761 RepID=UPI002C170AB1|nr:MXAN_6640 family putative metalloprotease [Nocardioides sp.]HXH80568.1 MXAN_6640 family putative metalloprotease [Nocardioides sp.]
MRSVRLLTATLVLLAITITGGPVAAAPVQSVGSSAYGADEPSQPARDRTLDLRDAYLEAASDVSQRGARYRRGDVAPRPSDPPDGSGELFWDPAAPRERLCGQAVCVHYVTATSDAPPLATTDGTTPDWVRRNLAVAEFSLARMVELGYPAPPTDDGRGGGPQFDLYLADISRLGLYGYCAPEAAVPGAPGHASSYCVFDNDFRGFPMPADESLRVTAAHELFHAVQFGMDVREDRWFLEATATWIEEQVADDVNDNRQFLLAGQLAERRTPLDVAGTGLASYGNWIFFQFLAQRHGVDAVRQIWALASAGPGAPDHFSVEAVRRFVESRGPGMTRVYAAFTAANMVPRRSYDEGASYRAAAADRTVRLGARRPSWRARRIAAPHLSSHAVGVRALPGTRGGSRLRITVDATRPRGAIATTLVFLESGKVARGPIHLDDRGIGRRFVAFGPSRVRRVVLLLVNASTRYACGRQTEFACHGVPRDDRQRFAVSVKVVR